jgi:hypothetical protein
MVTITTKSNSRFCQDRRGGADAEEKNRARSDIDEKGYEEGRLFVPPRSIPTRRCHDEEVFDLIRESITVKSGLS